MPFVPHGIAPLDAVLNVRVTRAETVPLPEDADLAGLSVSALVRRRSCGRPILAHADAIMGSQEQRLDNGRS